MPLGTEVDLGPSHVVLDRNPSPKRGHSSILLFCQCLFNCGQTVAHLSYCWALVCCTASWTRIPILLTYLLVMRFTRNRVGTFIGKRRLTGPALIYAFSASAVVYKDNDLLRNDVWNMLTNDDVNRRIYSPPCNDRVIQVRPLQT